VHSKAVTKVVESNTSGSNRSDKGGNKHDDDHCS